MKLRFLWNKLIASIAGDGLRSFFNILHIIFDSLHIFQNASDNANNEKENVLVIRLDAIGDFFVWLDAAKALREIYPKDKFHLILLANSSWAAIAKELDLFDEIISINRNQFKNKLIYRFKILASLKKRKYQFALHPAYARELMYGDSVMRTVYAVQKIGFTSKNQDIELPFWAKWGGKWYTLLVEPNEYIRSEFERNQYFINRLGLPDYKIKIGELNLLGYDDKVNLLYDTSKSYFVIFPGARVGKRQWGEANFAKIANLMVEHTNWQGLLCGSADEHHIAEKIKKESIAPLINLAGKTNMLELVSVIKSAQMLIGNETSGVHIAASVGTKSICVLGGGHFGRFVPYPQFAIDNEFSPYPVFNKMPCYNCNWRCIYNFSYTNTVPCIKEISTDMVWDVIKNNNLIGKP